MRLCRVYDILTTSYKFEYLPSSHQMKFKKKNSMTAPILLPDGWAPLIGKSFMKEILYQNSYIRRSFPTTKYIKGQQPSEQNYAQTFYTVIILQSSHFIWLWEIKTKPNRYMLMGQWKLWNPSKILHRHGVYFSVPFLLCALIKKRHKNVGK